MLIHRLPFRAVSHALGKAGGNNMGLSYNLKWRCEDVIFCLGKDWGFPLSRLRPKRCGLLLVGDADIWLRTGVSSAYAVLPVCITRHRLFVICSPSQLGIAMYQGLEGSILPAYHSGSLENFRLHGIVIALSKKLTVD